MRIIGLTGGIGAGKSAVAARLAARGAVVIDVDAIGRQVLEPGGAAEAEVIEHFGPRVVDGDGRIDRARLAKVVFSDREELAALEAISHPAINAEIDRRLAGLPDDALVVLDMAVLVGSRLGRDLPSGRGYDTVVVVDAPEDVRVARLVELREMSEADARARIAAQPRDVDRHAVADHIVVNDGELAALDDAVDALIAAFG
ncbi:MAG: dephospho-CoA kinase [Acidimicrobiia bacterium]